MFLLHWFHIGGYIVAGTIAFVLSAYFEFYFFETLMQSTVIGLAVAVSLEIAKVSLIITGAYEYTSRTNRRFSVQTLLKPMLVVMLVTVSLAASLTIIAKSQDRPNLKAVMAVDKQEILDAHTQAIEQAKSFFESKKTTTVGQIDESLQMGQSILEADRKLYEAAVRDLKAEGENVINGVAIGPRYEAKAQQLKTLEKAYKSKAESMVKQRYEEIASAMLILDDQYQTMQNNALNRRDEALKALQLHDYDNDMRVYSSFMASAVHIANFFLPEEYHNTPHVIAVITALIVSIILEIMIYQSFSSSTTTHIVSLRRKHQMSQTRTEFEQDREVREMLDDEYQRYSFEKAAG